MENGHHRKAENKLYQGTNHYTTHQVHILNIYIYIQLTKDYTTGNATFKQGSRGTVIEATSRKDGKLKVKLDNDDTKTFRLIKECDLQFYDGVASSPNCKSQTEEESFEY